MSDAGKCPNCTADLPPDAPSGLCPKCLIAAGLDSQSDLQAVKPKSDPEASTAFSPAPSFAPPAVESLADLFPQLEILELLGHGGMGAVYKARQTNLDRLVALKIVRPGATQDPSFAERFNREAKTLARLNHSQIVTVYDFGEVNFEDVYQGSSRQIYYFLMEFVDGVNLRQLMKAGDLAPEQALVIVPQICEALQYAHDEGVVHRDIKPENILLDKRGRVKIADFGLAKLASRSEEELTLTGTQQVMGTPRYMAPEQMEDTRTVDHRADIYSLGVVFYEMLTGEAPMGHFDPPSKKVQLDIRLDEIVLRSLARDPERRYQQADEVKTDVESISSSAGRENDDAPKKPSSQSGISISRFLSTMSGWILIFAGIVVISAVLPWKSVRYEGDSQTFAAIAYGFQLWSGRIAAALAGLLIAAILSDGVLKRPIELWRPLLVTIISICLMPLIGEETSNRSASGQRLDAHVLAENPPTLWGATEERKQSFSHFLNERTEEDQSINIFNQERAGGIVAFASAMCLFVTGILQLGVWVRRHFQPDKAKQSERRSKISNVSGDIALDEDEQQRAAELAKIAPGWLPWPILGLFALGWVIAGLLWNFRWPGLVLSIGAMVVISWYVMQLRLRYLPKLQSERERESLMTRSLNLANALVLLILALLSIFAFQVSLGDTLSNTSLLGSRGLVGIDEEQQLKKYLETAAIEELSSDEIDLRHRATSWNLPIALATYGCCSCILTFFAFTSFLHTRRYRFTWKYWWGPGLSLSFNFLAMLALVYFVHLLWSGYSSYRTEATEVRLNADWDSMESVLTKWMDNKGYELVATGYSTLLHAENGTEVGQYHARHIAPRSWFDRYQASWQHLVVRPQPTLYVTAVTRNNPAQSYLRIQLPSHDKNSPELAIWTDLVNELERNLHSIEDSSGEKHSDK